MRRAPIIVLGFLVSGGCYQMESFFDTNEDEITGFPDGSAGADADGDTDTDGDTDIDTDADSDDNSDTGEDTGTGTEKETDSKPATSACDAPDTCYPDIGWPSGCQDDVCASGDPCHPEDPYRGDFGLCGLPCDTDAANACPDTGWGLVSRCFVDPQMHYSLGLCFLTGCESNDNCPVMQTCESYATCPHLVVCLSGEKEGCPTFPECEDAPAAGTVCYPDNY